LTAERTLLNFVQLLSGTATRAHEYAQLVAHTSTRVLDTRKTIPGLRLAQKYAVSCGGGHNHRIGLFDQYLIKENHIAAKGGIAAAVAAAKQQGPESLRVEVEVESLTELDEAIQAGADIALIDNFTLADTREAVKRARGRIELEASGGITAESITDIADTGVDYISTGDVTKQVTPLDLSMLFGQRT
jgi:nicotinate-nucleotide pyrophosphorylase (carboxylating)